MVPSNMDDFENLPENQDPDVSGVLFIFTKGLSVDDLNAQEPNGNDEPRFSSTQIDRPPETLPNLALYFRQEVLINQGKVEPKGIQWKTVIDKWSMDGMSMSIESAPNTIDAPISIIHKGRYTPSLPGMGPIAYYKKLKQEADKEHVNHM